MAKELTKVQIERRLKNRIERADQKGLANKVGALGPNFFVRNKPRQLNWVTILEPIPWEEHSDHTYWEWHVIFPIQIGKERLRMSVQYHNCNRHDFDQWAKVSLITSHIGERDREEVVLDAIRCKISEKGIKSDLIIGGWRYQGYIPGKWELWLDIGRIEKHIAKLNAEMKASLEKDTQTTVDKQRKGKPSAELLKTAGRFGLV